MEHYQQQLEQISQDQNQDNNMNESSEKEENNGWNVNIVICQDLDEALNVKHIGRSRSIDSSSEQYQYT